MIQEKKPTRARVRVRTPEQFARWERRARALQERLQRQQEQSHDRKERT
jgi:hypothetical protein